MTGTMQEDIAREIEGIAKKKGFEGVQFNDIWSVHAALLIVFAIGNQNTRAAFFACMEYGQRTHKLCFFVVPFLSSPFRRAKSRLIQGKEGTL
jgi:hypothetical protein